MSLIYSGTASSQRPATPDVPVEAVIPATPSSQVDAGYTPVGANPRCVLGYTAGTALTGPPTQVSAKYRILAAGSAISETLVSSSLQVDLTPGFAETIVPGSVRFDMGGLTYIDRSGFLFHSINPTTGAGTSAGTIDYQSGVCNVTAWAAGASSAVSLKSLLTTQGFKPVEYIVFRSPVAPLKPGVFQVRVTPADGGGQITGTANNSGVISNANMEGTVDYDIGICRIRFGGTVLAAGHEAEPWFNAANVVGSGPSATIFKPRMVLADTFAYNAVAYSYLPLSASILGLDPVRLPVDGRVPIYTPGDVVVVLHDQTTIGTYTSGTTLDLGRGRLAKLSVRDLAGNPIASIKYTADLDTGIITWGDLTGVSQPLTIVDRIEDSSVLTDVQINGTLSLSQPVTHNFPANETLVSNAVVFGNLYAHTSTPFDQQTWTGVWQDTPIGSATSAQYNNSQYPVIVTNEACIQERWAIIFATATTVNVVGEHIGQVLSGVSINAPISPNNPNTNTPYFTLLSAGWGGGWSAGNVLRINTLTANAPVWIIMAIAQGDATDPDYSFAIECIGDVDNPI